MSRADAARQVALAGELDSGHDATAEALDAGLVSPEHAAVIVRATGQLPDTVSEEQRQVVEASLVAKAARFSPDQLRRIARRAIEAVEPDQVVDAHENELIRTEEQAAREKCSLTLHDNGDGTTTGHFTIPALAAAMLGKVIDAMSAPRRMREEAADRSFDWRHRRGLAFAELLEHLPTGHLHNKTAATVVVTLDHTVLAGAMKAAHLDTDQALSAGEARRLACNAGILPAVLGTKSVALDLGRESRLFSEAQRVAKGLEHTTCAAPAANAPTPGASSTTDDLGPRRPHRPRDAIPLCPNTIDGSTTPASTMSPCPTAASGSVGGRDGCRRALHRGRAGRRQPPGGMISSMTLRLGRHSFSDDRRLMMAIVNRTPDSFYDKGATWSEDKALERVAQVVEEGAEIVDIGGIKAAPGEEIDVDEEMRRTVPFVERVRAAHPQVVVSVDTWRAPVAQALCEAGADLINDAWGGADPALVDVAAAYDVGIVCTHTGGVTPRTRPHRIEYADVVASAVADTTAYAERALAAGVARESIVIDPAHDFGKTTQDSLDLTRRLDELVATGWPVLVSLSNKDFVGESLDLPVGERLTGTLAASAVAALHGARIFRVHEVTETRQVVDMVDVISGHRPPARTIRGRA